MSQHPGRGLSLAVLCIQTALQPSPRLGSTLPKGGWHNDSPSKVSAIRRQRRKGLLVSHPTAFRPSITIFELLA